MNKNIFWTMIETAKTASAGDLGAMAENLKNQLLQLDVDDIVTFDNILHGYMVASYKDGLWSMAGVIKNFCSDDGFTDFRLWLIAQGKETYLAVLKNLDNLADIEIIPDDTYGTAQFGDLLYLVPDVYEQMTGEDFYTQDFPTHDIEIEEIRSSIMEDIEYMEGIDKHIDTSDLLTQFPKIVGKYVGPDWI